MKSRKGHLIEITPVKPPAGYRHYSNPESQGSLIRATDDWPTERYECGEYRFDGQGSRFNDWVIRAANDLEPTTKSAGAKVPAGLSITSEYTDRMAEWDSDKFDKAWKHLSKGLESTDKELLAFVREYFGYDVVAVRTVYYYNVGNGYSCPRIDIIYREAEKSKK